MFTTTTDATRGQSLHDRVETRKLELELSLSRGDLGDHTRTDIEQALSSVEGLMTGGLDHLSGVVAAQLNTWLETNKYLAVQQAHSRAPAPTRPDALELGWGLD